jgi:hypothetical protein
VVAGSFALPQVSAKRNRAIAVACSHGRCSRPGAPDLHSALPIGVGIDFVNIDPIKALFWSTVINGVVGVPLRSSG